MTVVPGPSTSEVLHLRDVIKRILPKPFVSHVKSITPDVRIFGFSRRGTLHPNSLDLDYVCSG